MDEIRLRELLAGFRAGLKGEEDVVAALRGLPFEDLGFAKVDHHRALRCGFPEVIYGEGKRDEQVAAIVKSRLADGGSVLVTRIASSAAELLMNLYPEANHHPLARTLVIGASEPDATSALIPIVSAGTVDEGVAQEARVTAESMGERTEAVFDVGVAGLYRLLAQSAKLQAAKVIVVVAGMDGALASVVGGLVSAPVIAVPTSAGYGASFGGLSALMTMLNSCAPGVATVNIDNGFGAGYLAAVINRQSRGAGEFGDRAENAAGSGGLAGGN
jgi:NCAIR mutase (PurE)-related protein